MKTIIMAGGKGSRISELFPDIPKPLIPINGIPVLERELILLKEQNFCEIIITVGYMADKIMDYFEDGHKWGVSIEYFVEEVPLGNAGALLKIRKKLGNAPFLLLNADAIFDVDFNRMLKYHMNHCGLVTLFTHPNSHPYDSGLIVANELKRVTAWIAKEDIRKQYYHNRVNAGLHIIDPVVLDNLDVPPDSVGKVNSTGSVVKVDLDRQILKPLCNSSKMFCYDSPEYVKDMGTPERYFSVQRDFEKGIVFDRNLRNKQKAIFLDRDGTVNKYVGFLRNASEFELLPGVVDAIKKINESAYLCIIVTNQPIIARGESSLDNLDLIHKKMETELGENGAYIDGLYYCPHHPQKGFEGEIKELKIVCDCRKPKPGMLFKASKEFNIDLSKSWMIGDSENDILAGKQAGCKTVLLSEDKEFGQDYRFTTLKDAINNILVN